jgi:hypothetical protein
LLNRKALQYQTFDKEAVMRGLTGLGGLILFACAQLAVSADAGNKQVVVASVNAKDSAVAHARVARAHPAASSKARANTEGDSRLNDYRLERESCCGPQ